MRMGVPAAEAIRRTLAGYIMAGAQSTPPAGVPPLGSLVGGTKNVQTVRGSDGTIYQVVPDPNGGPATLQPMMGPDGQPINTKAAPTTGVAAIQAWAAKAKQGDVMASGSNTLIANGDGTYQVKPTRISANGIQMTLQPDGTYAPPAGSQDEINARTGYYQGQAANLQATANKTMAELPGDINLTSAQAKAQNAAAANNQANANKTNAELPGSLSAQDLANQKAQLDNQQLRQTVMGALGTQLDQISQMVTNGQLDATTAQSMRDAAVQSAYKQYQTGLTPDQQQAAADTAVTNYKDYVNNALSAGDAMAKGSLQGGGAAAAAVKALLQSGPTMAPPPNSPMGLPSSTLNQEMTPQLQQQVQGLMAQGQHPVAALMQALGASGSAPQGFLAQAAGVPFANGGTSSPPLAPGPSGVSGFLGQMGAANDVQAKIANGMGAGGLGPAPGGM